MLAGDERRSSGRAALLRSRATAKPNIVVIWGDDIGITNLSCYSDGLMGYRTPSIDRIAQEGMRFTDCYGARQHRKGLHHHFAMTGKSDLIPLGSDAAPHGVIVGPDGAAWVTEGGQMATNSKGARDCRIRCGDSC
jgi:hypothetical protein